ncbi:hypothetical protein RRG08_039681 [Elysia crispata]|uniref:Uncharacterized protein n=1 Tax=Elysia crispata TaxID=231223 RepID=A0AAE0Y9X7_9GAST|nr:hypothetical protein RRG08_039681 [Elysia crispata]
MAPGEWRAPGSSVDRAFSLHQVCLGCATLFRAQGCTASPNLLCQLVAFKLLFDLSGTRLCDQRPCTGYGQTTTDSCTAIFNCPPERIDINGVCDGLDLCCRAASSNGETPGSAGSAESGEDMSLQIDNNMASTL